MLIDVIAAGLHPRVRSQAGGSHTGRTDQLPFVPGIDGVGRGPDGQLRYFVLGETTMGAMAEQTVIDPRASVVLPESGDPIAIAAAINPAISSWVALRQRVQFHAGDNVVILGATGSAGRIAIQIARLFGATKIIAAGRSAARLAGLASLGATETVLLEGRADDVAHRLGQVTTDVDVVIDYLWGEPTAAAMVAVATHRADRGRPLSWIEIGSVAGPTAAIPSAALRAVRMQIVGSGIGSVSLPKFLAEVPELVEEITKGTLEVRARAMPLADVEQAWADSADSEQRIVLTVQP
jgi:NADPH:quinone reductase-like Zn-dependent oxidoreductase